MGRATILRIIEPAGRCVWIGTVVAHVQVFDVADEAVVLVAIVEGVVAGATHRPSSIGEFASSVLFVRLVECVCMVVSCLLSSTTYGSMGARIGVHDHIVGLVRGEVTNIELLVHVHVHVLIAVEGLLPLMMSTRIMIGSLVELVHLIDGVMVLSSVLTELSLVTLMDRITSSSRCSLLTKFSLSNCLRN